MKKDKYLWTDFEWCIRCMGLNPFPKAKRLWPVEKVVAVVCKKCCKELKKIQKKFEKEGTYAVRAEPKGE